MFERTTLERTTLGRICSCLLVSASLLLPPFLCGQGDRRQIASNPDPTLASVPAIPVRTPLRNPTGIFGFPQLKQAAGIIFSGRVTAISPSSSGKVETVSITFHVEQAIRGATPGEDLVISQWMGLWAGGQRYRVGEHVLLFLYPPSRLGLTSCVGSTFGRPLGRFALDPSGAVLLAPHHLAAFRTDPILGSRSRIPFNDFAKAVRHVSGEE